MQRPVSITQETPRGLDINATQFTMQRYMKDTRVFDNHSKIYLHTTQVKQKNNDRRKNDCLS